MALTKKEVDGFKWNLDVNDGGISRVLNTATTDGKDFSFAREIVFMNILYTTIKPVMVCIDLGANIGYATMFMIRNSGPSGYVYAIDPDNHNLDMLTRNIKENDYDSLDLVETTRCLITDFDGDSPFWIASQPNLNSVKKTKHSIRQETIPCFSLDLLCRKKVS